MTLKILVSVIYLKCFIQIISCVPPENKHTVNSLPKTITINTTQNLIALIFHFSDYTPKLTFIFHLLALGKNWQFLEKIKRESDHNIFIV
jgi:hypothetical protein